MPSSLGDIGGARSSSLKSVIPARRSEAEASPGINEPAVRPRFAQLGLDIASPQQQRPEGLAAFHKAEIGKWWPIIKSANIEAE